MTYLDDLHEKSDRIEDHREAVDAWFGSTPADDDDYPIDDRHEAELELAADRDAAMDEYARSLTRTPQR